jgi:hypothetical protein
MVDDLQVKRSLDRALSLIAQKIPRKGMMEYDTG